MAQVEEGAPHAEGAYGKAAQADYTLKLLLVGDSGVSVGAATMIRLCL